MRQKRIVCAVVAFLMVGANLLWAGRVFAEEIGGGDEGGMPSAMLENDGTTGTGGEENDGSEGDSAEEGDTKGVEKSDGVEDASGAEGTEDVEGTLDTEGTDGASSTEGTDGTSDADGEKRANVPMLGSTTGDAPEYQILMVGDTVQFDYPRDGYHGTDCFTFKQESISCNLEAGEVTFNETGYYTVALEFASQDGSYGGISYVDAFVFDVTVDGSVFNLSEEDAAKVRSFAGSQLKELMQSGEMENEYLLMYDGDWEVVGEAMGEDYTYRLVFEKYEIEEEYWNENGYEAAELVKGQIQDGDTATSLIAAFIVIYVGEDNRDVGMIYELDAPVTLWVVFPESVMAAPAGFTREFFAIRGHTNMDGIQSATRLAMSPNGNAYGFLNDRFSSFMFVYRDVPAAPNTGAYTGEGGSASSSVVATVLVGVALVTLYGAIRVTKR